MVIEDLCYVTMIPKTTLQEMTKSSSLPVQKLFWSVVLNALAAFSLQSVRGAVQKKFGANLGFCPNWLDPPPPSRTLGHQQLKFFLMFILHFRLF